MSTLTDEKRQAIAARMRAAVTEFNMAIHEAVSNDLMVDVKSYEVREMQRRFPERIYSVDVLEVLS